MKQFKNVLLNFQKQYSDLQEFEEPLEDEELELRDKLYFMSPPEILLQPNYVLTFELILLDYNQASAEDRVYAWGAFPLINFDLRINEGKFKLPVILGSYTRSVDKFKEIEGKIKRNIDEWVGNLYITIRTL